MREGGEEGSLRGALAFFPSVLVSSCKEIDSIDRDKALGVHLMILDFSVWDTLTEFLDFVAISTLYRTP